MKIEKKRWQDEIFGIELTAENEEECKILNRFWESGVKVNAVTRRSNNTSLQLTFLDLMK